MIFYSAGEAHGIRNPGKTIAMYIVFEFHGSQKWMADEDSFPPSPSQLSKLKDR
jgi:hypothetical protein